MNITINKKGSPQFSSIQEGDLFIYGGRLYLKRTHSLGKDSYNVCQVGVKNGGGSLPDDASVTPVNDIVVS